MTVTVKDFLNLLEPPLNIVEVDLYFGDNCEGAIQIIADKLITSEYADRKISGFDFGEYGLSITIE